MTTVDADILIIGAGSAGLSVAAGAAQLGKKVVLVEKGEMGGDCLNYGCVPSKALLAAGHRAHAFRTADKFGIPNAEPEIDFAAVNRHVHGVIGAIAPHDSQERFEGLGCTVLRDRARFTGPREAAVGETTVRFKHALIATGSTPFVPPIKGLDAVPFLTNETLFELTERPAHLVIIGGGPIGLEMAHAHRRLGSAVTVIEAAKALGAEDPELAEIVLRQLRAEGVEILEGASGDAVRKTETGVAVEIAGRAEPVEGSHLLVAVGRRANVEGLGLDEAGVAYTPKGVAVDGRLRSTNKRIYAAGDVAGGRQFTHVAGYHSGIIVRNMIFKTPAKNKEELSPRVTYTDPEIAHIGLTEAEARDKHGDGATIVRWTYEENDRAQAERATDGLVKVVLKKNGEILGASIVGKNAGDLIGSWALALASGLKISAFTGYIAPYPTLGEVSKRAAGAYYTPTLFSERTRFIVRLLGLFD
ncbi:MAG: FAD-dependent oxidoreductase [Pseudomonadota bacterium]